MWRKNWMLVFHGFLLCKTLTPALSQGEREFFCSLGLWELD